MVNAGAIASAARLMLGARLPLRQRVRLATLRMHQVPTESLARETRNSAHSGRDGARVVHY